ncbi:hypothetical protein HD554DRAFT_1996599, partial [Boletus coccyginus]
DVLIADAGVVAWNGVPHLCNACKRALEASVTPDLAIANHLYLSDIPEQLTGLTVIEEAMIARCARSCIIQLREGVNTLAPNVQRGTRGHIIVLPQQPELILDLLPPSVEQLSTFICVLFVGSQTPS